MLADLLEQQGIDAGIEGEHLQGAAGVLPAMGLVHVVVPEEDWARARQIIEQWERSEAPRSKEAPPKKAKWPMLRGFALGLAVGVGAMMLLFHVPGYETGMDYNGDGVLDEKWTYSLSGRPLKYETDRNLDAKVDNIGHFDSRGFATVVDSDDDFNGSFETLTRMRNGNPEVAETDTDGNGTPDLRTIFDSGVLQRLEHIHPNRGVPFRVDHFHHGGLQFSEVDSDGDGKLDTRLSFTPLGEVAQRQPLPLVMPGKP